MNRIVKFILPALLLSALTAREARTQATVHAATCSQNDVVVALGSVSADNTTVVIPACPSGNTWGPTTAFTSGTANVNASGQVTYTQKFSMTIQGQSFITSTDSLGNPTGFNDQTLLIYATSSGALLNITTAAGKMLRITGISVKSNGTATTTNGVFDVGGTAQSTTSTPLLRLDHIHMFSFPGGTVYGTIFGWTYGVMDHSLLEMNSGSVSNGFRLFSACGPNDSNSHICWSQPAHWGTVAAFYFENNTYNFAFANDCQTGGVQVYRYNTFKQSLLQSHRASPHGCRSTEMYMNNFIGPANPNEQLDNTWGSVISWGNTLNGVGTAILIANNRSENPQTQGTPHCQIPPPGGIGYPGTSIWSGNVNTSGTSVSWVSGTNFAGPTNCGSGYQLQANSIVTINGVDYSIQSYNSSTSVTLKTSAGTQTGASYHVKSNWDGNTDANGYPAYDQIGRGAGDLLQGAPPTMCDTATTDCSNGVYTGHWPNQAMEPVYEWLNNYINLNNVYSFASGTNTNLYKENREYYQYTTSFNGSLSCSTAPHCGVGSGLFSARPMTCTPMVAYWATDQSILYQCTATNVWTPYYTPFTYPHPLVQMGAVSTPVPPTGTKGCNDRPSC